MSVDPGFSLTDILARLAAGPTATRAVYGLRHGSMRIGVYAPQRHDPQTPHGQDELYIIVSGTGDFVLNATRGTFAPQDVLFVPAGTPHRFENFSDNFVTWVIFWGPEGGE
ncbi:MAG: cupin domain-containing protein [Acidiphilium sp.]